MPIPFNPPEPVYPTWGQSIGSGLDAFMNNYARMRMLGLEAKQREQEDMFRTASWQYQTGSSLTPEQFAGINSHLSAGSAAPPYRQDLVDEAARVRQQGADLAQGRAGGVFYNPRTGETIRTAPGARPLGGAAESAKRDYINDIVNRHRADPDSVSEEEKQIAGLASKRMILSGSTAQLASNARDGIMALNRMEEILEKNPNVFRYANTGMSGGVGAAISGIWDPEPQEFRTEWSKASDVITRIRTGAALNKQEMDFYPKMIAQMWSNPQAVRYNLQRLRGFYQTLLQQFESGERVAGVDVGRGEPVMRASSRPQSQTDGAGGVRAPAGLSSIQDELRKRGIR